MIAPAVRRTLEDALGDRVRFDAPLSRFTSLRIGGPADAVVEPEDREELARVLSLCAIHGLPATVLGGGFNTLVLDGGIAGVVVRLARFRRLEERPGFTLRAEAGVSHARITRFCLERGLGGLEFGAGVPGSVGGWIAMNAGVPAREVEQAVLEVEVMSPTGARRSHLRREGLRFGYRALRGLAPGSVILSVLLAAEPGPREEIRARVERTLTHRRGTQPLDLPSCGSVFKNPPGDHAGRLIELAGLKGERVGAAQISSVHANFIVNHGGASARDVLELVHAARSAVQERTGIQLEPEVRILGRPG